MCEAVGADPLRLERCPQCGYQLDGLPAEGACPECGRRYDQSVVFFYGWARGSYTDVATARPWALGLMLLAAVAIVWNWVRSPGPRDLIDMIFPAAAAFLLCHGLWRRWSNPLPAPIQVRLSAAGCCQLNNPRNLHFAEFEPWSEAHGIRIKPLGGGRARLRFVYRWKWPGSSRIPVDAEVLCTPQQADALRRRIERWRAAAATAAV
jgi:hypothetical protein